jgi:Skp family chaperone for outer membrane proteins
MFSMMQTSDARQAVLDSDRQVEAAAALEAEVKERDAALDERETALAERESALKERETAIGEKEAEQTARQTELDQQTQQQQQQQQQQDQQNGNQGDGQWFYWSCDDARNAGVATINQGQPGYRAGLDANNNGVACEPGE